MQTDQVSALLRDVADRLVVPRFGGLHSGDIIEKGPGDLVTVADREAELELTRLLHQADPGAFVVGEEGVFTDPKLLDVRGALKALPELPLGSGSEPGQERTRSVRTGTYDAPALAPPLAGTGANGVYPGRLVAKRPAPTVHRPGLVDCTEMAALAGRRLGWQSLSKPLFQSGRSDLNRRPLDPQSGRTAERP